MKTIELSIDELVFEGVSDFDAQRISQAVEFELTRLLQTQSLPEQMNSQPEVILNMTAEQFQVAPTQIGQNIARAIYQALA